MVLGWAGVSPLNQARQQTQKAALLLAALRGLKRGGGLRVVLITTVALVSLSAASWFGLFVVAMGLGFKSDWSLWDHSLLGLFQGLVYVFCLPSWLIMKVPGFYGSDAIIVLSQLVYSLFQAVIIHRFRVAVLARNK